jgi:Tripartite tricarboxylate transporter TctA family
MDLLANLALGFGVAFTPINLAYAFGGALLGTLIGVLPGLGPVATIAMLLPSIYALDATPALIMLAGIYYGAQYGGSTTAILINVPGESSSVVTAIDGYQMARKGRVGAALAAAGLGSFFAGCVGTIIIAAFAPPLTELAFKFGPAEYFSLMVLGLIGAVVLASGSLIKAIAMILLGLLLGQINTDVISGVPRYSFDIPELTDGIGFVAIAMGVFGFGEIITNLGQPAEHREVFTKDVKGLWPTKQDFKDAWPAVLRGTSLGSILGVLPGGGALLASFAAYTVEKKMRMGPNEVPFGKGNIRGVAGPEAANNAGVHPDADARHPAQCGDGADGRRDDDQGHPARPAGDDQQPATVLGPDRVDVGRQPDAGDPQPAADRYLDQVADGAVPLSVSGDHGLLLHRPVHAQQQPVRCLYGRVLRRHRLHVLQARLRAGAVAAGLHPRADDGREPAPRAAAVARRLDDVCDAAAVGRAAAGRAGDDHRGLSAVDQGQARRGLPGRGLSR